jgi:hypothetical protein
MARKGTGNTFKTRKNIRKEIWLFQMSQTALLYCSILQARAIVLVNVKAVTPRIRVIVYHVKIWNWSWHKHCNVRDVILHR